MARKRYWWLNGLDYFLNCVYSIKQSLQSFMWGRNWRNLKKLSKTWSRELHPTAAKLFGLPSPRSRKILLSPANTNLMVHIKDNPRTPDRTPMTDKKQRTNIRGFLASWFVNVKDKIKVPVWRQGKIYKTYRGEIL